MGIAAQLSATRTTVPAASLEEEFLMMDMSMPSNFRAVIPLNFKSASVALFNTGDMPEHATVACSTETGASFSTVVSLAPHQTVLNPACDQTAEQNTLAIDQDPRNMSNSKSPAAISVTTDGMPGSLAVWGMAKLAESDGAIALNFTNPSTLKTAETIFVGVPIGSADLLPGHSFKPALAVANFSGSPRNVTVAYNTMQGSAPSTIKVATLQLPPMTIQHVALSDLASDPALKNSFVITSDGAPGDVISNLVILGGESMQPVQLLGKDSQVSNGGGHPWNIDQGDRATVFLFNRASKEELFNVNVVANETRWHQEYTLQPGETKSVDIHKIVTDQEADKKGNKLPANATSGEVSWFTVDPGKGSGRVLISNAQSGLARNFSCGYNLVLCGSFLYSSVATFGIGEDGYLGDISDYTCTAYANNACSGQQYDQGNGGYSYSWSSGSPGIAPTTGSTTEASGEFYGQSMGNGVGTGQLSSTYCQSQSSGTNTVLAAINLNGSVISAATPGSLLIGQQATLNANVGSATIQSATSSVGGTTIGSWTPGSAPSSANFSQSTPTFYWVTSTQSGSPASVSVSGTLTNNQSFSGSASVNITAPSVAVTPTNGNDIFLINSSGNVGAGCGHGVSPDVCIDLAASISGASGNYEWGQVVTATNYSYYSNDGSQHTCMVNQLLPALDNRFPYQNLVNQNLMDSPAFSVSGSSSLTSLSSSTAFTTVLLWQPTSQNAIYVPISTVTWGYSFTVTLNAGTWSLTSTTYPNAQATNGLMWPQWSSTATNGQVVFTCN